MSRTFKKQISTDKQKTKKIFKEKKKNKQRINEIINVYHDDKDIWDKN
jgi:hypothetical protein